MPVNLVYFTHYGCRSSVVLMDGDYRYEVPFIIVEHETFDNYLEDQVLEKGRVGNILLYHPAATMATNTHFSVGEEDVETGSARLGDQQEAVIPVRVPFDYDGNRLELTSRSYLEGGAFLEVMHTEVRLLEPAYIAMNNARLSLEQGEQEVSFVVQGIDARDIETLSLVDENDDILIVDWEVRSSDSGSMKVYQSNEAEEGAYDLVAEMPDREILGVIAVSNWERYRAFSPDLRIASGDDVYLTVVSQGEDLSETTRLESDDDLFVLERVLVDNTSMVLRVKVDESSDAGAKWLGITGDLDDYDVYLNVINSEL